MAVELADRIKTLFQAWRILMLSIQVPDDSAPAHWPAGRYDSVAQVNRKDDSVGGAPPHFSSRNNLITLSQLVGKLPELTRDDQVFLSGQQGWSVTP